MKNILFLVLIGVKFYAQNNTQKLINGVFITNKIKYYNSTNCSNELKTTKGVAAYFSNVSTINITPDLYCQAGNIKYNSELVQYNNSKRFYSQTEVNNLNEQHWKINGANNIPNMNFIYNGTLPDFNINKILINDTIRKSDTLFIKLNNIQDADSIFITLSDNNQLPDQHHIALLAPNYSNIYYLPPSLFSQLNSGPRASVKIDAINYNYQTIAGKKYLFRNIYSFIQTGINIIN